MLNTLQQLGGAAGIAVLIAVLTLFTGSESAEATAEASLHGMRATFIAAALLTAVAAVGALFLPRVRGVATAAVPVSVH